MKIDKQVPKVFDVLREFGHDCAVSALPFGETVIDRPIGLAPCRQATICPGRADHEIGDGAAQLMEKSIVGSAYCAF